MNLTHLLAVVAAGAMAAPNAMAKGTESVRIKHTRGKVTAGKSKKSAAEKPRKAPAGKKIAPRASEEGNSEI